MLRVVEPTVVIEDEVNEPEITIEAGERTESPVCSESEIELLSEVDVPETETVIWVD